MTLRYLAFLGGLFLSTFTYAQITTGTIDYTERYTFDWGKWLSVDRRKEMEERMANGEFDQTGRVSFDENAFSYQQLPPDPDKLKGRNMWMARMNENPEIFYISIQDSVRTDRRRIMDRAFILEEKWKKPDWNIANMNVGMKELPLPNRLATAIMENGDTLTAYFTESIPLPIGPKGYGGLPGAILYLKVQNEGRATEYTMKTMQPNASELQLEKPSGEKAITREEYDKQMQRAREAMERRRRSWDRGR